MAMPARKLEWEVAVEDRLGKLEAHVEHIRTDISDLKVDVRRLNDKVDEVDKRLNAKIDTLRESIEKQLSKLNVGRAHDRIWFLLIGATILGVMAHGFKWI